MSYFRGQNSNYQPPQDPSSSFTNFIDLRQESFRLNDLLTAAQKAEFAKDYTAWLSALDTVFCAYEQAFNKRKGATDQEIEDWDTNVRKIEILLGTRKAKGVSPVLIRKARQEKMFHAKILLRSMTRQLNRNLRDAGLFQNTRFTQETEEEVPDKAIIKDAIKRSFSNGEQKKS